MAVVDAERGVHFRHPSLLCQSSFGTQCKKIELGFATGTRRKTNGGGGGGGRTPVDTGPHSDHINAHNYTPVWIQANVGTQTNINFRLIFIFVLLNRMFIFLAYIKDEFITHVIENNLNFCLWGLSAWDC